MRKSLTTRIVAETLGLSVDTVVRYHLAGRLPGEKLPGRTTTYLFAAEDVDRLRAELLAEAETKLAVLREAPATDVAS